MSNVRTLALKWGNLLSACALIEVDAVYRTAPGRRRDGRLPIPREGGEPVVSTIAAIVEVLWVYANRAQPTRLASLVEDEKELIERAKRLDPEAWDVIFNRYYPEIYAYLRYRTATPEDAEDLAATVFERAVKHIGSYRYRGQSLGAWLQRIASNLVTDYYRRRRLPTRRPEELPLHMHAEDPSPVEHVLQQDVVEQVHHVLQRLPEHQRDVLILRFLLGYSLEETASIMGKNVNAIKALQHRALKNFRQAWQALEASNERGP